MEEFILAMVLAFALGIVVEKIRQKAFSRFIGYLHVVKQDNIVNLLLEMVDEPSDLEDGETVNIRVVRK